jgi:hypothetical protein
VFETISVSCPECDTSEDILADAEIKIGYILVKFQRLCEDCIAKPDREEDNA